MMKSALCILILFTCAGTMGCGSPAPPAADVPASEFAGRWDVMVEHPDGPYPSWFELRAGEQGWEGRFVGRTGSARPIQRIEVDGDRLVFQLPPQYEERTGDLTFSGRMEGERIRGVILGDPELEWAFSARPAPALERAGPLDWEAPVTLSEEGDISKWKPRHDAPSGWTLQGGILANRPPGADLITGQEFSDFRLELEFRIPEGSNSGIYLRGRYEVQISDSSGREANSRSCGSIYGFITAQGADCRIGEWNRYEIELVGRRVTVALNGVTVIDGDEIPGITGGALDSREELPGPLMLQGDHGEVEFRNILITPAVSR